VSNEANILPSDIKSAHSVINKNLSVINELALSNHKLQEDNYKLIDKNQELQQQVDWFTRQLFGERSEKTIHDTDLGPMEQLWLGGEVPEQMQAAPSTTIKEHVRKRCGKQALVDNCGESGLRFDSSVPVEEIPCPPAEIAGLKPEEYEVIDTKVTERLCQRSSYYVKRYLRTVVKLKASKEIVNQAAPEAVFERSYADATLLAGILVDKFQYYMPLYRQHQRMAQSGIKIARANLTSWTHRTAALFAPIYSAVLVSALASEVLALDESPMKAGQEKKGKLHRGYMWVLYGDKDEAVFLYSDTRAMSAIEPHLKNFCGKLITDGYTVYGKLCTKYEEIEHALCWAHARREFFEAKDYEPDRSNKALKLIRKLYDVEDEIRELKLEGIKKQQYRALNARSTVDAFFEWLKEEQKNNSLLPSNKFQKAAAYALNREEGLRLYLSDPDVPIDTNHLERQIRPIPLGRKNWLFCWTEVGAHAVAIIQTLISCCKLHGVNPFEYFVDVLSRIDSHPAARVDELTPRNWAAARKLPATP